MNGGRLEVGRSPDRLDRQGLGWWGGEVLPSRGDHPMSMIAETKPTIKRPRKMAREPKPEDSANNAYETATGMVPMKRQTKVGLVLDLLARTEGATLNQLVAATGWLPHTTRAALTGLKKKGHALNSEKVEGHDRIYYVVSA